MQVASSRPRSVVQPIASGISTTSRTRNSSSNSHSAKVRRSTDAGPTTLPISNSTTTPTTNKGLSSGAVSLKPRNQGDKWHCGTCGLWNPAAVVEKCAICDAIKPGGISTTATTAAICNSGPSLPLEDTTIQRAYRDNLKDTER